MSPEDRIQAAWVQRAAADKAERQAKGLAAHEMHCEPWMPEVAVQALRDAGWTPPQCNCPPDCDRAIVDRIDGMRWEAGICGAARPLTPGEFAAFDAISDELKEMRALDQSLEQAMRDIADGGEWPEVGA